MATGAIGIDFGTTNSSIAYALSSGDVELARFPQTGGLTEAYRSLLYLEQERERGVKVTKSWTGPEGIERYLAAETKGRLIQSLKFLGVALRWKTLSPAFCAISAKRPSYSLARRFDLPWLVGLCILWERKKRLMTLLPNTVLSRRLNLLDTNQ